MVTVKDILLTILIKSATDRIKRFEEISAPISIINGLKLSLQMYENGNTRITDKEGLLKLPYVSHEEKKGRGGNKYVEIVTMPEDDTEEQVVLYFPNARYGPFITKKKTDI